MSLLSEPMFGVFARGLLAAVFASAAVSKIGRAEEFHGVVRNFRIGPEAAAKPVALILPWIELAVALALLAPWTVALGAWGSAVLLVLFAAAMSVNLRRGRRAIDCGCFRAGLRQNLSWSLVARNLGLTALAVWLAAAAPGMAAPGIFDLLFGAAAAGLAFLIYVGAALLGGLSTSRASASTHGAGR